MQGIVGSLPILAAASSDRGDYEQAEEFYAEGLSLSRELDSAYLRFLFLSNWGWTALLGGDYQRATVLVEEAVELARERSGGLRACSQEHSTLWGGRRSWVVSLVGPRLCSQKASRSARNWVTRGHS